LQTEESDTLTRRQREIRRSDEQYTPIAGAYISSRIHAQGEDLPRLVELAGLTDKARLLDVGTGAGHTALAFSSSGVSVIGLDLTQAMLVQAQQLAAQRDLDFTAVRGAAELMPFQDAAFDGIACRYCAHHFVDVPASLQEMHRTLKPAGVLVFVDLIAPDDDEADEFVNYLEWLRDQSHRREARKGEYETWFHEAGFRIDHLETFSETIVVDQWFARAQTSPENEAEARRMLASATPKIRELFAISADPVAFELNVVLIRATAM
jgi:ubiquinone/menaquinone biosynthesis C-methylase UbiE